MFFFDDYIEPARDPAAAPWRWRWPPGGRALVRFGARASRARAGRLRYSFSPVEGPWTEAALRPAATAAPPGHVLWEAEIPAPGGAAREASCLYEIGRVDAEGRVHWSGRRRPLLFSDAPWRGMGAEEIEVGRDADGAVMGPQPLTTITPAPTDWPARTHYALLVDRFAIGAPERRGLGLARFDPACPFAAHGGDLAGVIDRLDYLAALGVGAILLSPLNLNGPEGYHGYHPVDLYAVEPRLGDLAAVQALVQAAHRRGLAVLLDQVLNHVAPMLDWRRAGEGWRGVFRYDMADARHLPLQPEGLRDPACFHDPSTDGDDVRGRLFGFLDDWRAEREDVAAALVRSLKYWLAATDADGFRYDAVRHVEPAFCRRCTGELRRYAAAIGKTGFRQYGEHSSHLADVVDRTRAASGFDGMIDYPLYYPMRDAMGGEAAAYGRLAARLAAKDGAAGRDLAFVENHDSDRMRGRLNDSAGAAAPAAALAWTALLFLGPDAPMVAQGQEQEFHGRLVHWRTPDGQDLVSDAYVREDLFPNPDCVWRFGPVNDPPHPPYDARNPTFRAIAALAHLRRAHPALHAGPRRQLRDAGDGFHAVEVGAGAEALLVAVNLTDRPQTLALDRPAGPALYRAGDAEAGETLRLGPYAAGLWEWKA